MSSRTNVKLLYTRDRQRDGISDAQVYLVRHKLQYCNASQSMNRQAPTVSPSERGRNTRQFRFGNLAVAGQEVRPEDEDVDIGIRNRGC